MSSISNNKEIMEERELDEFGKYLNKDIPSLWKRNIKRILFDSNNPNDHWSIGNSDFRKKINDPKAILIVIEDKWNNLILGVNVKREPNEAVFGDFILGDRIDKFTPSEREYFKEREGERLKIDETSIHFLRNFLGIHFDKKRFPIKEGYQHFYLGEDDEEILFGFGYEENEGKKEIHDIVIYKDGSGKENECREYCYDYGEHTILEKDEKEGINPFRRLVVYELTPIIEYNKVFFKIPQIPEDLDWELPYAK